MTYEHASFSHTRCPRIVFLFSDTGGGHRSAAQAIIEALEQEFPGQTTQEMVDFFREVAPPLLERVPDFYPPLSRHPRLLGWIFHSSDGARRTKVFLRFLWPYVRPALYRLLREHPADLYVSVHPLINAPFGRALDAAGVRAPFVTVVTDLVTTHATWFWERANLIIVPTEAALRRGVACGYPAGRIRVVGLPVADGCRQAESRPEIRAQLGLPPDLPMALLVGGGEGVGPLEEIAMAIDAARLPLALVIVTGRNQKLKARLERLDWRGPVSVQGFVRNMPEWMRAADFLITKAGPGTISEAFAAGLPLILYSRLDGPEEGNVPLVVDSGAGIWAPSAEQVVQALASWLSNPASREQAARASLSLAKPNAAREIAHLLMEVIQV